MSSLNVGAGETRANLVFAPASPGGVARLFNPAGSVHLVVDLVAVLRPPDDPYASAGRIYPVTPARLLDTRTGAALPVRPGDLSRRVDASAVGATYGVDSWGAFVNLTATEATDPTYLVIDPDYWGRAGQGALSPISTLNLGPRQTVPNLGLAWRSGLVLNGAGSVHAIVDLQALVAR